METTKVSEPACLSACLDRSYRTYAEHSALRFIRDDDVETTLTYAQLDVDVHRMGCYFTASGIRKGDRVILFLPKSVGFLVAHLSLLRIGAVSVPVNPGFRQTEMDYLVSDTDPALIVADTPQAEILEKVNSHCSVLVLRTDQSYDDVDFFRSFPEKIPTVDIQPQDPGTIIYTSGTTGQPKGAILTQGNLAHDAMNIIDIWQINDADRICHALPLFHVHGLGFAVHTALMAGSEILLHDRFIPQTIIGALARKEPENRCSVFMAVPAMYVKMIETIEKERMDFDHVRLWTSGSAPLLTKDFDRIKAVFGKAPVEREGMSETGMNFSNPLNGRKKPGSIGRPLPQLEVKIVSPETGTLLPSGEVGEIWLKGPGITPGYWQKPQETTKAFEEGWFKTGDLGYVDQDGYYFLTDRLKNIIISGGENISPKEVETVINQIDGVLESSVVGIPDEKWGEKVVAAIKCRPGAKRDASAIRNHCRDHLHAWKTPKDIRFVEEIPKNRMGKVLTHDVRQLFTDSSVI